MHTDHHRGDPLISNQQNALNDYYSKREEELENCRQTAMWEETFSLQCSQGELENEQQVFWQQATAR